MEVAEGLRVGVLVTLGEAVPRALLPVALALVEGETVEERERLGEGEVEGQALLVTDTEALLLPLALPEGLPVPEALPLSEALALAALLALLLTLSWLRVSVALAVKHAVLDLLRVGVREWRGLRVGVEEVLGDLDREGEGV